MGELVGQTSLLPALCLYNNTRKTHFSRDVPGKVPGHLRGPVAILFVSRDTCGDSIAKLFRACFCGLSHNYRAICCKMGYRTDVPM